MDKSEVVTFKEGIVEEVKNKINGSIKKDILDEVTNVNNEVKNQRKNAFFEDLKVELGTDEIKQKLENLENQYQSS